MYATLKLFKIKTKRNPGVAISQATIHNCEIMFDKNTVGIAEVIRAIKS